MAFPYLLSQLVQVIVRQKLEGKSYATYILSKGQAQEPSYLLVLAPQFKELHMSKRMNLHT